MAKLKIKKNKSKISLKLSLKKYHALYNIIYRKIKLFIYINI
jgi:hypothetical protein